MCLILRYNMYLLNIFAIIIKKNNCNNILLKNSFKKILFFNELTISKLSIFFLCTSFPGGFIIHITSSIMTTWSIEVYLYLYYNNFLSLLLNSNRKLVFKWLKRQHIDFILSSQVRLKQKLKLIAISVLSDLFEG